MRINLEEDIKVRLFTKVCSRQRDIYDIQSVDYYLSLLPIYCTIFICCFPLFSGAHYHLTIGL